mmetsp:Transcript_1014/g.2449  ORF Transcript_1014/g.2449 Transcript_1014/m.2449 type:complete len:307 (-) Transcript_1014:13-933(-)
MPNADPAMENPLHMTIISLAPSQYHHQNHEQRHRAQHNQRCQPALHAPLLPPQLPSGNILPHPSFVLLPKHLPSLAIPHQFPSIMVAIMRLLLALALVVVARIEEQLGVRVEIVQHDPRVILQPARPVGVEGGVPPSPVDCGNLLLAGDDGAIVVVVANRHPHVADVGGRSISSFHPAFFVLLLPVGFSVVCRRRRRRSDFRRRRRRALDARPLDLPLRAGIATAELLVFADALLLVVPFDPRACLRTRNRCHLRQGRLLRHRTAAAVAAAAILAFFIIIIIIARGDRVLFRHGMAAAALVDARAR